jgi:hypothetical protein
MEFASKDTDVVRPFNDRDANSPGAPLMWRTWPRPAEAVQPLRPSGRSDRQGQSG